MADTIMGYPKDIALIFLWTILLLTEAVTCNARLKSATFLLPFSLEPGSVMNRKHYNVRFPRGHIGVKSFSGEVVDEAGKSVPLHEVYLHHWVVWRYFQPRDNWTLEDEDGVIELKKPKGYTPVGNSGPCQGNVLRMYFALGSETRMTDMRIPDPYGIEVGNPTKVPAGYVERWMIDLHVIDTRGVEDRMGCTECKCELYNITVDKFGLPLKPDYTGGSQCCDHRARCRLLREGMFEGGRRNLYLRYTVTWINWESSVLPVKIFIFDVTDTGKRSESTWDDETAITPQNGCQVEYKVEACSDPGNGCIDNKRASITMPSGGYVVFGRAHQHSGGMGSTLYGQDGGAICTSMPIYGEGEDAGNESGYVVGMTTCYPRPGSVKLVDGQILTVESNYSSSKQHTGVMCLFYILVADQIPDHMPSLAHRHGEMSAYVLGIVTLLGPAVILASIGLRSWLKRSTGDGYQPIWP